jgi:single-strand DNA-binding protein
MATSNINRVVLTGNLTRDPVLRNTSSGTPVCGLRIASNTRRKTSGGEWVDKPNYLSVTVWGALGENCHRFLAKGRPVAIDGRLEWREWEAQDGTRRESVEIVADSVQFLGGAPDANSNHDGGAAPSEPEPVAAGGGEDEDDIPF